MENPMTFCGNTDHGHHMVLGHSTGHRHIMALSGGTDHEHQHEFWWSYRPQKSYLAFSGNTGHEHPHGRGRPHFAQLKSE